jgi:hypothetical protein
MAELAKLARYLTEEQIGRLTIGLDLQTELTDRYFATLFDLAVGRLAANVIRADQTT